MTVQAMVGRKTVRYKDVTLKVPDLEDCCRCTRPFVKLKAEVIYFVRSYDLPLHSHTTEKYVFLFH